MQCLIKMTYACVRRTNCNTFTLCWNNMVAWKSVVLKGIVHVLWNTWSLSCRELDDLLDYVWVWRLRQSISNVCSCFARWPNKLSLKKHWTVCHTCLLYEKDKIHDCACFPWCPGLCLQVHKAASLFTKAPVVQSLLSQLKLQYETKHKNPLDKYVCVCFKR